MYDSFLAQLPNSGLFPGSNMVRRFTFKMFDLRDNYALLAKVNNLRVAIFANTREQSAFFPKKDRFECLSPHDIAV
jgi:hypothetical protein